MKSKKLFVLGAALVWLALPTLALAQNAPSTSFVFQGQLNDHGAAAQGNYEFQYTLFDSATAGNALTPTPPVVAAAVNNGAFTTSLDIASIQDNSHSIQDNSIALQNNWLQVSVRPVGGGAFTPMSPRQKIYQLPASIYASETGHSLLADHVAASAVTHTELAPGAVHTDSFAIGAAVLSVNGFTDNVTLAAGSGVTLQNANGTITISATGGAAGSGWALGGNAGTTAGQFLGTTDAQPLVFKVKNTEVWRAESGGADFSGYYPANIIGGSYLNSMASTIFGSFIGEGSVNFVESSYSSIVGGDDVGVGSNSMYGFVGGGFDNLLGDDSSGSVMGGGENNQLSNSVSTFIGGGVANIVTNAAGSAIVGGFGNRIGDIFANGGNSSQSVIGGGANNTIYHSRSAVLGGGAGNLIDSSAGGVIGGGAQNAIKGAAGFDDVVVGGYLNVINQGGGSAIGGGSGNQIGNGYLSADYATIPGGFENLALGAQSFAAGTFAQATNFGSFVWSDGGADQFHPYSSVVNNEFAVRARGGVRFDTMGAGLFVDGLRVATGSGNGSGGNSQQITNNDTSGDAIVGVATGYTGIGVLGKSTDDTGVAISGVAAGAGTAIQGVNSNPFGLAAHFTGQVKIDGNASVYRLTVGQLGATEVSIDSNLGKISSIGAGVGTSGPIFVFHTTNWTLLEVSNVSGASHQLQYTNYVLTDYLIGYIDHPLCNGDPTALLQTTYQMSDANVAAQIGPPRYGVWYDSSLQRWAIRIVDYQYGYQIKDGQTQSGAAFYNGDFLDQFYGSYTYGVPIDFAFVITVIKTQ